MVFVVRNTFQINTFADSSEVLLFYSLLSSMRPILVGSMVCAQSSSKVASIDIVETSRGCSSQKSWKLRVCFDKEMKLCSITTRSAFSHDEVPFTLNVLPLVPPPLAEKHRARETSFPAHPVLPSSVTKTKIRESYSLSYQFGLCARALQRSLNPTPGPCLIRVSFS